MNADEIVEGCEQRDGVGVVLYLLGEGVGEPGEPAYVHPHREVLPFHVRRGHVLHVGIAFDAGFLGPGALRRAVAAFGALRRGAVDLDELRIVHVGPEGAFHGFKIGPVPVRRELDPIGEALRKILDEPFGALAVPAADEPRRDKLRICVERGPRPCVAGTVRRCLRGGDVLLFGVGETPNLVDLNALGRQPSRVLVMVGGASLPRVDHESDDRVLPDVHEPGDGTDRTAFAEEMKDLGAIGGGELVHDHIHMDLYAYSQAEKPH